MRWYEVRSIVNLGVESAAVTVCAAVVLGKAVVGSFRNIHKDFVRVRMGNEQQIEEVRVSRCRYGCRSRERRTI